MLQTSRASVKTHRRRGGWCFEWEILCSWIHLVVWHAGDGTLSETGIPSARVDPIREVVPGTLLEQVLPTIPGLPECRYYHSCRALKVA